MKSWKKGAIVGGIIGFLIGSLVWQIRPYIILGGGILGALIGELNLLKQIGKIFLISITLFLILGLFFGGVDSGADSGYESGAAAIMIWGITFSFFIIGTLAIIVISLYRRNKDARFRILASVIWIVFLVTMYVGVSEYAQYVSKTKAILFLILPLLIFYTFGYLIDKMSNLN